MAAQAQVVEDELHGEVTVVQAERSEGLAETARTVAEATEPEEVSSTPASEETPAAEAPALTYEEELQKMVAAVVT